jgi:hypothetical protein
MFKCMCYVGLGSIGCFVVGVALMGSHYRMDLFSSVGHQRLDSVMPLVLFTVAYNIQGVNVVL